ncbi:hypothetical protein GQ55_5G253700 [Panicum hallii var. hallii]|uniref:Uncharacterized protein n=1 Tax=Panicum hallii var. hallii TaxID=1504633 RepID=A0A2T7DK46_9POAL|nr:hypothetical protein GQ55_5G253700 [Panicum hallii var. hallii]
MCREAQAGAQIPNVRLRGPLTITPGGAMQSGGGGGLATQIQAAAGWGDAPVMPQQRKQIDKPQKFLVRTVACQTCGNKQLSTS